MAHLNHTAYSAKGTRHRTTPLAVARMRLAEQCLRLRRDGLTNGEIAERLSADGSSTLSEGRVGELIRGALKELVREPAEEVRLAELDRLDRIFNRALSIGLKDANRDRVPALGAALKAMERRAALLGLDAPKQIEAKIDSPPDPAPAALAKLVDWLAEAAGEDEPSSNG